jgi:hypothetical protein
MYISETFDYRGLVRSLAGYRAGRIQQGFGGLNGSFAGTLGTNSLPVEIQKLLDAVRKNPENYRSLLLATIFDPRSGLQQSYGPTRRAQTAKFGHRGRRGGVIKPASIKGNHVAVGSKPR